eukprot:1311315-Amphidinium_carterae.1
MFHVGWRCGWNIEYTIRIVELVPDVRINNNRLIFEVELLAKAAHQQNSSELLQSETISIFTADTRTRIFKSNRLYFLRLQVAQQEVLVRGQ